MQRTDWWLPEVGGGGVGTMGTRGQKVQTCSYKIYSYEDVRYSMATDHS